jgi:sigma-B regulation protein RsbU (phosphoserine phosphatase)
VSYKVNPDECLCRANKLLYKSTDSRTFISLCYGVLDVRENTFSYANAGHDLPLYFPAGSNPFPLNTRSLALGLKKDVRYEMESVSVRPGDRLLIYSDGITEAMNKQHEEFGIAELSKIMMNGPGRSAQKLVDEIVTAVNRHFNGTSQNDDMTILLLIRK